MPSRRSCPESSNGFLSAQTTRCRVGRRAARICRGEYERRAPECIAAISAKLAGLNDAQRDELKQQLRPVIEKLVRDPRSAGYRLSVQFLAARLGLAEIDAAEVRQKFLSDAEPESRGSKPSKRSSPFAIGVCSTSCRPRSRRPGREFAARILAALGRVENPKLADVILAEYPKLAPGSSAAGD